MTEQQLEELNHLKPWEKLRYLETRFDQWSNGLISDGEILLFLAGAASSVAYLQGIVSQSIMDDEAQVAEAKMEAAGFKLKPVA